MADPVKSCILGVQNKEKIIALERDMSEMKTGIHEIRDKLLGRPTWKVTMAFTSMVTVIAVLLQALLK